MRVYSATDVGQKRKMNQDYVFVSETPVGNLQNLFVVADGMKVSPTIATKTMYTTYQNANCQISS